MNPVALSIEELLLPLDFMSQPSRRMTITRAAIRTTLSFLALCCALYVPDFVRFLQKKLKCMSYILHF